MYTGYGTAECFTVEVVTENLHCPISPDLSFSHCCTDFLALGSALIGVLRFIWKQCEIEPPIYDY